MGIHVGDGEVPVTASRRIFDLRNRIIEALARQGDTEVTIVSAIYKSAMCAMIIQIDGRWRIKTPMGGYLMRVNPFVEELLAKYVKLADVRFDQFVGPLDIYDDVEDYQKAVARYVEQEKPHLTMGLIRAMEEALKQIS